MDKLSLIEDNALLFECPGCKMLHVVHVGVGEGPRWDWTGSMDSPTFSPSVLVTYPFWDQEKEEYKNRVCHSFVKDGTIQFLGDCTHTLANQTVPIPDWED